MNGPNIFNAGIGDSKQINKSDNDEGNETKYEAFPNGINRTRAQHQSNTEAIIGALEKLHSKLQQLQQDRDLANQAVQDLTKQSEQLRDHLFHQRSKQHQDMQTITESPMTDVQSAEAECQAIEENLKEIMKLVQTHESYEPSHQITMASTGPPPPVTIKKLKVRKQSPTRRKAPNSSKQFTTLMRVPTQPKKEVKTTYKPLGNMSMEHRHYKLNFKHLPFIMSKVPGPSFSLPVNIQLLIASLKVHSPWFCSLTRECSATKELILKVDQDLQVVLKTLQNSIECLTLESWQLQRKFLPVYDTQQNTRITQLTSHRNALISHMQEVRELQKQLHKLKEHFIELPSEQQMAPANEQKTKFRMQDNLSVQRKRIVPSITSTSTHNKQKNKTTGHRKTNFSRKPWNEQVAIPLNTAKPKHSISTLRYMEVLQAALKRNGLRLKST